MYKPTTSCGEIGLILHEIFMKFFGYKLNGTFVEIGAHDGKIGSFTYNLAVLGWKGIYCEPVPSIYEECLFNHKDHKNVAVVNCAVGEKEGTCEVLEGATLSTIDNDMKELYKHIYWAKEAVTDVSTNVVMHTTNYILKCGQIDPNFELLVIDVEGSEEGVLKSFSIETYRPQMIIIEIPDQHEDYRSMSERYERLRTYFVKYDYTLIVNDVVDNVYIRSDLVNDNNKDYTHYCSRIVQYKQYKD